jgi:uncharacterized oxidoreductase
VKRFSPEFLQTLGTKVFTACGAAHDHAAIVAEHLVASNLMGVDSHGVVRIPLYVGRIRAGEIDLGGAVSVVSEQGATAVVDCGFNFGQLGGLRALEVAVAKAREHKVACVVTKRCRHIGRLGHYTHMAAEEGMFAQVFVTGAKSGHFVVPYGGSQGRLPPAPVSWAVPGPDHPIVADMAMSTASLGKIMVYRNRGEPLPKGWIVDAAGNPSTDPNELFKSPPGHILPFGGNVGYKSYAFLLLAEILAGRLAGTGILDDVPLGTNGVCFIVVDISAFLPLQRFKTLVAEMIDYIKSSPPAPGFDEVVLPGELDFRTCLERKAQGIPIEPVTWQQIKDTAEELGVSVTEAGQD